MLFSSAFGNRFFGDFFPFLKAPNLDFCAHSQCFRAFSQNRRFRKSTEKKLDFGVVFGGQSDKKSWTNNVAKHVFFQHRFFTTFLGFLAILARFREAQGPPKIQEKLKKSCSERFWSTLGIFDRIWEGSGRVLGRFWEDFWRFLDGFRSPWSPILMDFGALGVRFWWILERAWSLSGWRTHFDD